MALASWMALGCSAGSGSVFDDPSTDTGRERRTSGSEGGDSDGGGLEAESDAGAPGSASAAGASASGAVDGESPAEAPPTPGSQDSTANASANDAAANASTGGDATRAACTEAASVESQLRRLSDAQYRNSIESIFGGLLAPSEQYPAPSGSTVTGYASELGHEPMSEQDVERATLAAEDIAVQVPDAVDALLPCAADANQACAETFLDETATRAYRRPLSEQERELLLGDFDDAIADGFTFAEAIGVVVAHMLAAPQFLYVVEDAAPERRALSGYELAHRLSLLLWDSPPDDQLLAAAESGQLDDPSVVRAQAERLLASDRADAALSRFFREWTQTSRLFAGDKSEEAFPAFDAGLASSMNESFDRLVVDAVRSGRSLSQLLSSSDAWVDGRLAGFLSIAAPAGGWQRVSLDASIYRGLLTQPAWLASLAHSNDTSFVFRGRFVQKRLLCNDFGPPPPNAMSTEFDLPENPTARQRSEAVRSNPTCAGCHELMDPIGLSFEVFDGIGQHRSEDALGRPIDTSGTLGGGSRGTIEFGDHLQLIEALEDDPKTLECYAHQIYRFATAHRETEAETCAVQAVHDALLAADGDLGAGFLAVATGEAFRHREAP
jgi:hypothetical protein